MLCSIESVLPLLRCPRTHLPLDLSANDYVCCAGQNDGEPKYQIWDRQPVLIDYEDSVLTKKIHRNGADTSAVKRRHYSGQEAFLKDLVSPTPPVVKENIDILMRSMRAKGKTARVLIVGGGTVGKGTEALYEADDVGVVAFDIYASPFTQFVADAHAIPVQDGQFDAVIIQAVLEHVLDPNQVVSEIWRVLKPDGLVYAETPFMQQVHEGAYDFTRYTEIGHRYLFRRFTCERSGVLGGPGTQLMWSLDYFFRALFRSRAAGKVAKLAFFWTQYFDSLMPNDHASDGATGVYFLGQKTNEELGPNDIIRFYKGAQRHAPAP